MTIDARDTKIDNQSQESNAMTLVASPPSGTRFRVTRKSAAVHDGHNKAGELIVTTQRPKNHPRVSGNGVSQAIVLSNARRVRLGLRRNRARRPAHTWHCKCIVFRLAYGQWRRNILTWQFISIMTYLCG